MQMSEVLDKLKSLQDVLAEKYDIENEVVELPKSLDGSTEGLERFKKEYIDTNKQYEDKKTEVAKLRSELDEVEKTRESGEKEMDAVQTHREYEILEKQIAEASEKENEIRKNLQREEKTLTELKDKLDGQEALIQSSEQDVNERKSTISVKMDEYKKQIDDLSAQEKEMSEGIEPETLFKFQRIIQRNRKGIVAVRGNVCEGCHMILPAQFANEIRRGEKILFCPYCSRILFYEESESEDSNYFTMDEAGSLADLDEDEDFIEDEDLLDSDSSSEDEGSEDVKGIDYEEQ